MLLHSPVLETPSTRLLSSWGLRLGRFFSSIYLWWAIGLLWAGMQAWSNRYSMNPDGMSYLDIASETLKSGPHNLVNGHWSPLYPALISLVFLIFHPTPALEFPAVHLLNFFLFAAVLGCFTFFVTFWLGSDDEKPEYTVPFCFGIFLWFTMEFTTVSEVSPDLCMTGMLLLAAGMCCRISLLGASWTSWGVLGGILGLGYYTKSPLFVLGLILLAILFIWPPSQNFSRSRLLFAGLVFLIVTAPWVALISERVGHPSISETARLNYEWQVNRMPLYTGWTGGADNSHGIPEHPPRILIASPETLEFAGPAKGTYPLWYDPSYWYAGAKIRLNPGEQLTAIKTTLAAYYQLVIMTPGLLAGVLMLAISIRKRTVSCIPDRNSKWLMSWALCGLATYAVVHVEPRYVGAFFVLFWLTVYRAFWSRVKEGARAAILVTVLCTLYIPSSIILAAATAQAVRERTKKPDYMVIGEALSAASVNRGNRLAVVGPCLDAYYARYVGTTIVAQVVDSDGFWRLPEERLDLVKKSLAKLGVKAIVSRDRPVSSIYGGGWQDVVAPSGARYSILALKTEL